MSSEPALMETAQTPSNVVTLRKKHHVIIVGGGFAGLYAAKALGNNECVQVTLIDKNNYHLFQPLLYQVASGSLSPGDIASPLRKILRSFHNVSVMLGEVVDFDPKEQTVSLHDRTLHYDSLIWSVGGTHQYFGRNEWQRVAPGMKTVEDALQVRKKIMLALESAEKALSKEEQEPYMNFVIVGGGPTGVELAGTLAELVHKTFRNAYDKIDTKQVKIYLVEAGPKILGVYPQVLVDDAVKSLEKLGVTVMSNWMVTSIDGDGVTLKQGETVESIKAKTVMWTAGVQASPMGKRIAEKTGATTDRVGRVFVKPDLSIENFPNVYVAGDLAACMGANEQPLPCLGSVAMQEGQYVGALIAEKVMDPNFGAANSKPFRYKDKGTMAIIGRNCAVVDLGHIQFRGFIAWVLWLFVHIFYLIGFENKVMVMFQWVWNYITRSRTACLITATGYDEE